MTFIINMAAEYLQSHGIDLQKEIDSIQSQGETQASKESVTPKNRLGDCKLSGVRIPRRPKESRWDVSIKSGKVQSIEPQDLSDSVGNVSNLIAFSLEGAFMLPSLCHPHVHLDKCFIFSHPKYDDLQVINGDFPEALELTAKAKARFELDDLITRGSWLLEESIAKGVTHIRAFVEVDVTVGFRCLDAGLELKSRYASSCEVQICVFAQNPIFSEGENNPQGKQLIEEALRREGVDVLGSTPYVETNLGLMRTNVEWAISVAIKYKKHLDFHLDYNLDAGTPALTFHVIELLRNMWKTENDSKTVVLGHCSRLTLFTKDEWMQLQDRIVDLPIYFVGLPTSDIYMMGKPGKEDEDGQRVRGTLQIPHMIQKYNFNGAIGVNNIGNAFTPQGSCDPMSIASMGIGLYQAGTVADAELLFKCVSSFAMAAIGFPQPDDPFEQGAPADFVFFKDAKSSAEKISAAPRQRRSLQEIICDPPAARRTMFGGRLLIPEFQH